jgi:protocatechuate 3,4-dioxygenase beta subunit
MSNLSRRQLIRQSLSGLAAGGIASLALRADAGPTDATRDVHGFQKFLDEKGIPRVQPAGKWEPSHPDILGPYFLQGAPFRGKVTPPLEAGDLLVMRGRVWGHDTKKPIANALLDVWQADARGSYDLTDPRKPPPSREFRNRIRLMTDETGYYEYETIRPGAYRIGAGPRGFRPAHIHYMIQARGYKKLITQLYFAGDRHLKTDRWASQSNLVIQPQKVKVAAGKYELGTFDIVLDRS